MVIVPAKGATTRWKETSSCNRRMLARSTATLAAAGIAVEPVRKLSEATDGEPTVVDLIRRGVIGPDESTVVCITGNGYKTADVMAGRIVEPVRLGRGFKEFEGWWESRQVVA